MPKKLLCFPYAGGNSNVFLPWKNLLPRDLELIAIEYPGHGKHYTKPLMYHVDELVEWLFNNYHKHFTPPYFFFGHSLGALVCYELAKKIREKNIILPNHMIVSGYQAPQYADDLPPISCLPDDEFIKELNHRYNDNANDGLRNDDLLQLMLPILKADIAMNDNYVYKPTPPLDCPITALAGEDELAIVKNTLEDWHAQTTQQFTSFISPGNHMSVLQPPYLAAYIQALQKIINSSP